MLNFDLAEVKVGNLISSVLLTSSAVLVVSGNAAFSQSPSDSSKWCLHENGNTVLCSSCYIGGNCMPCCGKRQWKCRLKAF